jgi:hypothetical protein
MSLCDAHTLSTVVMDNSHGNQPAQKYEFQENVRCKTSLNRNLYET